MKRIKRSFVLAEVGRKKVILSSKDTTTRDNSVNSLLSDDPKSTPNGVHKHNADTLAAISTKISNLEIGISNFTLWPGIQKNLPVAIRISSLLLECLAVIAPKLTYKEEHSKIIIKCSMRTVQ